MGGIDFLSGVRFDRPPIPEVGAIDQISSGSYEHSMAVRYVRAAAPGPMMDPFTILSERMIAFLWHSRIDT